MFLVALDVSRLRLPQVGHLILHSLQFLRPISMVNIHKVQLKSMLGIRFGTYSRFKFVFATHLFEIFLKF